MRGVPHHGSRVLRASSMPGRATMWVDHTPRGDVVYVDAHEMTASEVRMLEDALREGRITVDQMIDNARR